MNLENHSYSCSSVINRNDEIYRYYVGEQLPIIGECKHIAGCGFTRVNYCAHVTTFRLLRKYIALLIFFNVVIFHNYLLFSNF